MKIGVLIDRITIGGVEKIALEEVAALQKAGHDVTLLVLSRKYEPPTAFSELLEGIKIEHLEDRLPRLLRTSFKMPLFAFFSVFHISYPFFVPFVVKKHEFDFILSHNPYTTFTAMALSKRRAIPYSMYMHDYISYILKFAYSEPLKKKLFSLLVPLAEYLDKKLLNNATAVFVQGDDHYASLQTMMKNPANLHYLSPGHGVIDKLAPKRGDYFLLLTAWKEGKRIEGLISMLQKTDPFKIKLAGKWIHQDYRKKIETQITEAGLQDKIEILGEVSESRVNELFKGARASIIYSNEKGFGLGSIEAASNGCTFIIPDNCGAARYFSNGTHGFFYKFGDDAALRQHMVNLATDDALAYNMGKNAWEFVGQHYSWQKHITTITDAMVPSAETAFVTAADAQASTTDAAMTTATTKEDA